MKPRVTLSFATFAAIVMLASALPACYPREKADNYVAVVPAVMQSGTTQGVSISLLKNGAPAYGQVEVSLLEAGREVVRTSQVINGAGTVPITIPSVKEGEYQLRVRGDTFDDSATVRVEKSLMAFLETDKPIYKPGQTIHMRVVTLNSDLKPASDSATIEVLDAKGIKIFRTVVKTDDYGFGKLDLPISSEPNLGVWKIVTTTDKGKNQLDIRVEEYVLPKYEVKVELPKEWFLVNERIKGKIKAEYSFGKPVRGDLEIKVSRYVGQWQQYTTFNATIDGEAMFDIAGPGYVAGTPASGGLGNVQFDVTVKEKATGYTEKTSRLLTVASSGLKIMPIPASSVFKPGLPLNVLVITQTPDNQPRDVTMNAAVTYVDKDFKQLSTDRSAVVTSKGKAILTLRPPADATGLSLTLGAENASVTKTLAAGYSPSGNFIHVEQSSEGTPNVGDIIKFKVNSTSEASNFYYEVVSRGKVVFSDFTRGSDIAFMAAPAMAPASKLLVYQILPNSEVAADYIPFKVSAQYPEKVNVTFSTGEAKPGQDIKLNIETDGEAKVGIAAVDKSVFILAENRLNLQQVFDELERLYMKPQAELHEVNIYTNIDVIGARDVFKDAGVIVLSNGNVPDGKKYENPMRQNVGGPMFEGKGPPPPMPVPAPRPAATPAPMAPSAGQKASDGLAEVQRVRQYFPETWLWQEVMTNAQGKATVNLTVPDSITTWMLRAVAMSKKNGMGVAESELKTFQPFFVSVDLPYSAVRGEEFPVRVAIYNYLNQPQTVSVQIDKSDWFELLDRDQKSVDIKANDIGGVEFRIRPVKLGANDVKMTARSKEAADAVVKPIIIEAEGIARESVENLTLSPGASLVSGTSIPPFAIDGSGRAFLTVTASYLTQTIDGLEKLIQMPFGCGEQNMIVFAPDVYITKYLKESGQLKPEIMAKAEKLMITGYQRELTYRRTDGSFSAFGMSDKEGSLWLTAFVLKSFAQAKDLIYIDQAVLDQARQWIVKYQKADGSFDVVGFVAHQEMMGGVRGRDSLTAFTAIALMEAGEKTASAKAVSYLEGRLDGMEDPYTLAITTYALELAGSARKNQAYDKLMKMAKEDANGLHWGADTIAPEPQPAKPGFAPMPMPPIRRPETANTETTAYATLALVQHKDVINAGRAAKWLVSKRNAFGGYGSTQDTVVTLQALVAQATGGRSDVDLSVLVESRGLQKEIRVNQQNFDVLQVIELPLNEEVKITSKGKGEIVGQVVRRYNLPDSGIEKTEILKVNVGYDVTQVSVNDLVKVSVDVEFTPPAPMEAGMVVVDVSVPTGFSPVTETIAEVLKKDQKIKRYEVAGRKVIFYIENMQQGDKVSFGFSVRAQYPVKAKAVASQAYAYYQPEIRAESAGRDMVVS